MTTGCLNKKQLSILGDAIDIAEDMTSNYFNLSLTQWQRHPFDVRTLSNFLDVNIKNNAFAILKKYIPENNEEKGITYKDREYFLIYLQDKQILKAIGRDKELRLLPLLSYIIIHELVHIVRFCNFQARFDLQGEKSIVEEEKIVHQTTREILKDLSLPHLPYILGSYNPEKINMDVCVI
jgi:hypothetical protein